MESILEPGESVFCEKEVQEIRNFISTIVPDPDAKSFSGSEPALKTGGNADDKTNA